MNVTLDFLKSNRKWLVRGFRVWGDDGAIEADMLTTETDSAVSRVIYQREFSGGLNQIVFFNNLVDHRGNHLPASIDGASVILIPKNPTGTFVRGLVGPNSFRIAKERRESPDGMVDLLILEMC